MIHLKNVTNEPTPILRRNQMVDRQIPVGDSILKPGESMDYDGPITPALSRFLSMHALIEVE